jgi:SAM-dependent methyltransferase
MKPFRLLRKTFAKPKYVHDQRNCQFYHTIDLPGLGTLQGYWDLREEIEAYLGNREFSGKRVLDVGCANGFLSFYIESNGAEVVSFDLDQEGTLDFVPFAKDQSHPWNMSKMPMWKLHNAYWLGHRLLKSKAKVAYGTVYAIPEAIGAVDVSVLGCILLHLRDPFLALHSAVKLTKQTVIVAEPFRDDLKTSGPFLNFLPNAETCEPKVTWWDIRPEWIVRALSVLGFEDTAINFHTQKLRGRPQNLYTVVAKRTHGKI